MENCNKLHSFVLVKKCIECPFYYLSSEKDTLPVCVLSKHPVATKANDNISIKIILLRRGKLFPSFCPLKNLFGGAYGKCDGLVIKVE